MRKNHSTQKQILKEYLTDTLAKLLKQISIYLQRVAKKFNDMFISFRPLTEMVTVIGRSWLYPVAAHISFPVSTPSWKLEVTTTRLHQRAHLPYKSELFAPQSFLLYTLLRQPRGKDTISVS